MLKTSHASDLNSFASYYSLSRGILKLVISRGLPLPPSRMVRLTPAVYWNHVKGGVDIVSRILKTLARTNISENPVVSIIARLLTMQVNNGAVIYRLNEAQIRGILQDAQDEEVSKGYSKLRHRVSECDTFGSFARNVAKEWFNSTGRVLSNSTAPSSTGVLNNIRPMFARNSSERLNSGPAKTKRLNTHIGHATVTAQRAYCVLCTWTTTKRVMVN